MPDGFEIDTTELQKLAADITASVPIAAGKVRAAVQFSAFRIKAQAITNARGIAGGHARLYPTSITYDVKASRSGVEAEVGPERGRPQWGLGNLLEFGSSNNAPHPHLSPALDSETDGFVRAVEKIADGTL